MAKFSASSIILVLFLLLLSDVWMIKPLDANEVQTSKDSQPSDLLQINSCINPGFDKGTCNADSDCCGSAICRNYVGMQYCCSPIGQACQEYTECCRVDITLPGLGEAGDSAALCISGKCCAGFGRRCENDSDCCPNGDQPRECYKAAHTDKYCRN